jgi:hypothetical protein
MRQGNRKVAMENLKKTNTFFKRKERTIGATYDMGDSANSSRICAKI